jgi:hypothetical protein
MTTETLKFGRLFVTTAARDSFRVWTMRFKIHNPGPRATHAEPWHRVFFWTKGDAEEFRDKLLAGVTLAELVELTKALTIPQTTNAVNR